MPVVFAQARRFLRLAILQQSAWHSSQPPPAAAFTDLTPAVLFLEGVMGRGAGEAQTRTVILHLGCSPRPPVPAVCSSVAGRYRGRVLGPSSTRFEQGSGVPGKIASRCALAAQPRGLVHDPGPRPERPLPQGACR